MDDTNDLQGGDDNLIVLPGLGSSPEMQIEAEQALEDDGTPTSSSGELGKPPPHLVPAVVEALLLASDKPMSISEIDAALCGAGRSTVLSALHDTQARLREQAGGIRLVEVAKGWQLRTDVRTGPWVAAFRGGKPVRLSKAALETLSVVAYRQPVTRSEIEDLRGVDAGGVLRMLCERSLVSVTGRADEPGRPLLYCTTNEFLELFGLRDLSDLPTLRDLRELRRDDPREMLDDDDGDEASSSDGDPEPPQLFPGM